MKTLKYGKIKCKTPTNIFGTTIQLIVRMKSLIEGQNKFFIESMKDSKVIPAIIDAYEQFQYKKEYLDIDPFVHLMKKEVKWDIDLQFKDFFSSVLCQIDFSYLLSYCIKDKICFASLRSKANDKKDESFIFDIEFKKNQKLSELIQSQYELFNSCTRPTFLFFSPINNDNTKIIIDKNTKNSCKIKLDYTYKYTLSLIVVKDKTSNNPNHFILYACVTSWIEIEDEEITEIEADRLFETISDPSKYRIELFGFSKDPSTDIIPVYLGEPHELERRDINSIAQTKSKRNSLGEFENKIEQSKKTDVHPPSIIVSRPPDKTKEKEASEFNNYSQLNKRQTSPKKTLSYKVSFYQYDKNFNEINIFENLIFHTEEQRNQLIYKINQEETNKSNQLIFSVGDVLTSSNLFDENDENVTIYSVPSSQYSLFYKYMEDHKDSVELFIKEYVDNDSSLFDVKLNSLEVYFHPDQTSNDLYNFCRTHIGPVDKLFLKESRYSTEYKISEDQKKLRCNLSDGYIVFYTIEKSNKMKTEPSSAISKPEQVETSTYIAPSISENSSITVTRYLRTCIYYKKENLKIKRIKVILNSEMSTVKEMVKNIFPDNKKENNYIVYTIHKEKSFRLQLFDDECQIKDLPSHVNLQYKPHISYQYRICLIYDEFDPKSNGYSFAIRFGKKENSIEDIQKGISDYLFNKQPDKTNEYKPKIHGYVNGRLRTIVDINEIQKNKDMILIVDFDDIQKKKKVLNIFNKNIDDTNIITI